MKYVKNTSLKVNYIYQKGFPNFEEADAVVRYVIGSSSSVKQQILIYQNETCFIPFLSS